MLDGLNDGYGLENELVFSQHPLGLVQGEISNALCHGLFFLHGAHVARFQPAGQKPVLFMSERSEFVADKPIRGGVPLCFPWFGPHPTDSAAPAHGLVRARNWELKSTLRDPSGALCIGFQLAIEHWQLTYSATFGTELDLCLNIANLSEVSHTCEAALHTYLELADVQLASVHGLEQQSHLDKLTGEQLEPSGAPIRFTSETDRVYHGPVSEIVVHDPGYQRRIRLVPRGSHSTVVWNPWVDKSQRMPDFGDQEFQHMCCVETANVGENRFRIVAGGTSEMGVKISLQDA
jgi:glucose-6-phosphate 1-epimerase